MHLTRSQGVCTKRIDLKQSSCGQVIVGVGTDNFIPNWYIPLSKAESAMGG